MTASSGPAPGMKICPYCAEEIREAAVKCRFCHSYLTGSLSEQATAAPEPAAPDASDAQDEAVDEDEARDESAREPEAPRGPVARPGSKTVSIPASKSASKPASKAASKPYPKPKPLAAKTSKTSKSRQTAGQPRFPALARPAVAIVLGVVVVLLLALDAFLLLSWHGYRQQADARASGQVAAVNDIEKILSYNYQSLDKSTADAQKLMTPKFKKKYGDTAERVRADAPDLKAVVKAQVVASSVVSAEKDKVKALLFVNQTTTRNDLPQPRVDLNRVEVTLVKDGDGWLVDNIQAL